MGVDSTHPNNLRGGARREEGKGSNVSKELGENSGVQKGEYRSIMIFHDMICRNMTAGIHCPDRLTNQLMDGLQVREKGLELPPVPHSQGLQALQGRDTHVPVLGIVETLGAIQELYFERVCMGRMSLILLCTLWIRSNQHAMLCYTGKSAKWLNCHK